jgi:hypothetical protein
MTEEEYSGLRKEIRQLRDDQRRLREEQQRSSNVREVQASTHSKPGNGSGPGQHDTPEPQQSTWITANFRETQLKFMRPGQAVTIHVDTFARDFRGHVESMLGASGADPQHTLRPGMSVEPEVGIK